MTLIGPLVLASFLFCVGLYGVIARRNSVLVLMSVELMLNAVNINLVAFQSLLHGDDAAVTGHIFALFVIVVAAAEVGIGLAIVFNMFRNRASIDIDDADLMRW